MSWLQRASVAGVAAAAGLGLGLSTGTLDPAVALVTSTVMSGDEAATPQASPDRIVRVAMYDMPSSSFGTTVWNTHTWSATPWPRTGDGSTRRHEQRRFDPASPSSPGGPSRPSLPIGTPLDGSYPWRLIQDSVNPEVKMEPMHSCAQPHGPGEQVDLTVEAAAGGTVTASWWDLGDPDTEYYKLGAVPMSPQGGTEVRWSEKVPAPKGCKTVDASMSGLVKGQSYVLYLEAVNANPRKPGQVYSRTRAQSGTVEIP